MNSEAGQLTLPFDANEILLHRDVFFTLYGKRHLTRQVQILQAVEKHMFIKKRSMAAVLPYYTQYKQYAVLSIFLKSCQFSPYSYACKCFE
jgi:hypothetical protein